MILISLILRTTTWLSLDFMEYRKVTLLPVTSRTLPVFQHIDSLEQFPSLNTNKTISSTNGNLSDFNYLFGLRFRKWILSINIWYHCWYIERFWSKIFVKFELISRSMPLPSKDLFLCLFMFNSSNPGDNSSFSGSHLHLTGSRLGYLLPSLHLAKVD